MSATKSTPAAPRIHGADQPSERTRSSADKREDSAASQDSRNVEGGTTAPADTSSATQASMAFKLPSFGVYSPFTALPPAATSRERMDTGYRVDVSGLVMGFLSDVGNSPKEAPAESTDPMARSGEAVPRPDDVSRVGAADLECSDTHSTTQQVPRNESRDLTPTRARRVPSAVERQRAGSYLGSPEQIEEARNLRALWDAREGHRILIGARTYAQFAEHSGIGSYATVSHCLNGNMALSLNLARAFARGLGVTLAEVSPRWAAKVAASQDPSTSNETAQKILDVCLMLSKEKQLVVLQVATSMLSEPPKRGEV